MIANSTRPLTNRPLHKYGAKIFAKVKMDYLKPASSAWPHGCTIGPDYQDAAGFAVIVRDPVSKQWSEIILCTASEGLQHVN